MSNQPSTAFRRHHDVEAPTVDARAFRQGWRVVSRLDALLHAGRITPGEWQAAVAYREAWERVIRANSGNSALGMRVSGGAGSNLADHRLASVADTVTQLRTTEAAIGALAALLCFACAVEDCSWASTGRLLHRDPHTAQAWTIAAIGRLARAGRRRA